MKTATIPVAPDKEPSRELSDPPKFPASMELAGSLQSLENEQKEIDKAEPERVARLRAIQSLD